MLQKNFPKTLLATTIFIFFGSLFIGSSTAFAGDSISVHVNEEDILFNQQQPYINESGRLLVPLNFVDEVLEAKVYFDQSEEPAEGPAAAEDAEDVEDVEVEEKELIVQREDEELIFEPGEKEFLHNAEAVELNFKINLSGKNDTSLPIRPLVEGLGGEISWVSEDRSVRIKDDQIDKIDDRFTTPPKVDKVYQIVSNYHYLEKEVIEDLVTQAEEKNINVALLLGLIRVESNFDPNNVGSHAGARGLFQIMPGTGQRIASRHGLKYWEERLFDPKYNTKLATKYLRSHLDRYNEDIHRALTAYNRGTVGLENYVNTHGTAVSSYSTKVLEMAEKFENKLN